MLELHCALELHQDRGEFIPRIEVRSAAAWDLSPDARIAGIHPPHRRGEACQARPPRDGSCGRAFQAVIECSPQAPIVFDRFHGPLEWPDRGGQSGVRVCRFHSRSVGSWPAMEPSLYA